MVSIKVDEAQVLSSIVNAVVQIGSVAAGTPGRGAPQRQQIGGVFRTVGAGSPVIRFTPSVLGALPTTEFIINGAVLAIGNPSIFSVLAVSMRAYGANNATNATSAGVVFVVPTAAALPTLFNVDPQVA